MLILGRNTIVLLHQLLQCIPGKMLHFMLHLAQFFLHAQHIFLDAEQLLIDRLLTVNILMLFKISDCFSF